jgi:N-acetylmuramic acid 6-phosphate etherase
MAGARTAADRERIHRAVSQVWRGIPSYVTNDLETAMMAAEQATPLQRERQQRYGIRNTLRDSPRVLVLSGTGSCCYGRTPEGKTAKVGGWGHILGDKGSGFEIGLRALKAVVYYYDRDGVWSALGQRILRALQLNEPDDLIGWAQSAAKSDIAALAVEVFAAWQKRDKIASDILAGAIQSLARDAVDCARRLAPTDMPVQFILAGGVLVKQPRFASQVCRQVRKLWPGALVTILKRESVWGAVALAKRAFENSAFKLPAASVASATPPKQTEPALPLIEEIQFSPTEQRHPKSMNLHKTPVAEAIRLMLSEDAKIPAALLAEREKIEHAIRLIVRSFKQGGRLFYVGAGTSGRLGILDASECPPTFSLPPEMVQGIIAGGQRAIWQSVERAEDDPQSGARAIEYRGVQKGDVVVGIAASGRTPFVWGALGEAKGRGATSILICFNPAVAIRRGIRPDLVIAPDLGPEILTGSTRLKAGTATKLILNMLTTLSMVRLGKVVSNLMVDVKPSNRKLRDRAARIVRELTGVDYSIAYGALEKSGWVIKSAVKQLRRKQRRFTSKPKKGTRDPLSKPGKPPRASPKLKTQSRK